MTLGEYNDFVLRDATCRFAMGRLVEQANRSNLLLGMLAVGCVPPTRWQRIKNRIADYGRRAKDIWTILRGRDIHENCGY